MVNDLASSWCAAVEAGSTAPVAFRIRHHMLLDALRVERAPLLDECPLPDTVTSLRRIARRTADAGWHQQLRSDLARLATLGIDRCAAIVLLPAAATESPAAAEPIVALRTVVLLVDTATADYQLRSAMAVAAVALARHGPVAAVPNAGGMPRRWRQVQDRQLRDAVYTLGLGVHAAQALMPELAPHELLGVSRTHYRQLREGERRLSMLLHGDLDESGAGLALGWLDADAPASLRRRGGHVIPRHAGAYLAWKMTAPRVARVGLAGAMAMEA
jgi:hypothetical protein